MTHYVLVHGAWEGPWSWDYTKPVLEKHGHTITSIDLHGRSDGTQPVTNVTLASYVETVVDAINRLDHTVTLVGHSMAGAVISQVAERIPGKIEKLIFVAAFLLSSGDSVIEAMTRDKDGEFLPELLFSADQATATASPNTWRAKAFHDVREDRASEGLALVDVPQVTEPFMAKIAVTDENFGSVPKVYIRTAIDKMVSPKLQDEMLQNWPVDEVHVLQSGHFPTLSVPETLAELML